MRPGSTRWFLRGCGGPSPLSGRLRAAVSTAVPFLCLPALWGVAAPQHHHSAPLVGERLRTPPRSMSDTTRRIRKKDASVLEAALGYASLSLHPNSGAFLPASAFMRSRSLFTESGKKKKEEEDVELTAAENAEAVFVTKDAKQHCVSTNSLPPPPLPTPRELMTSSHTEEAERTTAHHRNFLGQESCDEAKQQMNKDEEAETCVAAKGPTTAGHDTPLANCTAVAAAASAAVSGSGSGAGVIGKTPFSKKLKEDGHSSAAARSSIPTTTSSSSSAAGGGFTSSETAQQTTATEKKRHPPTASEVKEIEKQTEANKYKPKGSVDSGSIPILRVVKLVICHIWPKGQWKMKALVVISLGCVLLAKVLKVMLPFIFKAIIDSLSPQAVAGAGAASGAFTATAAATTAGAEAVGLVTVGPLTLTACGFVAAYGICRVAGSFAEEFKNVFFAPVGGAGSTNLAMQMIRKLHDLDLPFHLNRETGVLSKDLDRGSRAFWNLAYLLLFMVAPTAFEMCLVGTALYTQGGGPFIGIAVTAVTAYIAWTLVITNWRAKFRARYNHYDSRVGGRVVDSLLNYETVKYFGSEVYECARIEEEVKKMNRQLVILDQTIALMNVGQQLIFAAAAVGSLYLATCGVLAGTMSVGDLVLVDGLLLQLYMPLSYLGMIYRDVQSSTQNMQAMIALMDTECVVKDTPGAKPYEHKEGRIEFRDVSFEYTVPLPKLRDTEGNLQPPKDTAAAPLATERRYVVLNKVNLTIPGGSVVAFVGASGSGKSTIFRLLFRFFNPTSGTVLLDGQPIDSLQMESVRRAIGVIPQDPILFNESVRYNIRYSRPQATSEEVERVARQACLHETLTSLADGYDTSVGERGCRLSGGEKQRVAIARALLDDRPILLADEATSALDTGTEAGVMRALRSPTRSGRRRTVLLIAHRLTTVKEADIIFVLGNGCVAEYGSHGALLSRRGIYAELWQKQLEEKRDAESSKKGEGKGESTA